VPGTFPTEVTVGATGTPFESRIVTSSQHVPDPANNISNGFPAVAIVGKLAPVIVPLGPAKAGSPKKIVQRAMVSTPRLRDKRFMPSNS
jgi:hypothetical protein